LRVDEGRFGGWVGRWRVVKRMQRMAEDRESELDTVTAGIMRWMIEIERSGGG
jgi:hypothetical protein